MERVLSLASCPLNTPVGNVPASFFQQAFRFGVLGDGCVWILENVSSMLASQSKSIIGTIFLSYISLVDLPPYEE